MTENSEWTTVSDGSAAPEQETKIVFEEYGDEFIGEFLGYRHLTDRVTQQGYTQARFRADDGEICYVRANHSMKEGLDRVRIGQRTRVCYVDDVDTGMPSPMRSFTVQVSAGSAEGSAGRGVRRATKAETPKSAKRETAVNAADKA